MKIFRVKKRDDDKILGSVIGEDAQVTGNIATKGGIHVAGRLEGNVHAQGDVLVGEGCSIKGDVFGKRVIVSGEVDGNIVASNGLEITPTGKVYGDITGDRLIVDEGAVYRGKVNMEVVAKKEEGKASSSSHPHRLKEKELTQSMMSVIKKGIS